MRAASRTLSRRLRLQAQGRSRKNARGSSHSGGRGSRHFLLRRGVTRTIAGDEWLPRRMVSSVFLVPATWCARFDGNGAAKARVVDDSLRRSGNAQRCQNNWAIHQTRGTTPRHLRIRAYAEEGGWKRHSVTETNGSADGCPGRRRPNRWRTAPVRGLLVPSLFCLAIPGACSRSRQCAAPRGRLSRSP